MAFEDLQKRKIELSSKLKEKLFTARERLAAAESLEKHRLVKDWLAGFAGALKELRDLIKAQQRLCPKENQCIGLLQEEIDELDKAILHIFGVIDKEAELNEIMVARTLILIESRAHSLPNLLKKSEEYREYRAAA